MFLVLKLLVVYIWCFASMRVVVQVMSAFLVDVSVAGRAAVVLWLSVWERDSCMQYAVTLSTTAYRNHASRQTTTVQ